MIRWGALVLTFTFLTGCFSDDDPKAAPDVPAKISDINAAQDKVFLKVDPTKIQKGQFVYTLRTQELYSSQEPIENLIEEEAVTVVDRENYGMYFDVTVVTERIDYLATDKPKYKFKDVYSIGWDEEPSAMDPDQKQALLQEKALAMVSALETSPKIDIEFLNLKVKEELKKAPPKVIESTGCQGADCLINVTTLVYDVIIKENGVQTQRNQMEVWLSADVPYFATILRSCIKTLIAVDTAVPLIRQCQSVYDYKFSADAAIVKPPVATP